MAGVRHEIPPYERVPSGAKQIFESLAKEQQQNMRRWRTDGSARAYGSAGVQPARNSAFLSEAGFTGWKAKHPKSPFNFQKTDIDADGIPDAVVWADAGHTNPVAVNGWTNKGSKARLYLGEDYNDGHGGKMDYWEANARNYGNYKTQYFTGPPTIKATLKKFQKLLLKPRYDDLHPKNAQNAEYRKDHPVSQYTSDVAQLLVGDKLDVEMAQTWNWDPNFDRAKLHATREYKELFDARLGEYVEAAKAGHPTARGDIDEAIRKTAEILEIPDKDQRRRARLQLHVVS
jgi:hypothetical protein